MRFFVFFLCRNPPGSADAEGIECRGQSAGGTRSVISADGKQLFVAGVAEGSMLVYNLLG